MTPRMLGSVAMAALAFAACGGETSGATAGAPADGSGGAGGGAGTPTSVGWVLFGQMFEDTPPAIGWATAAFVRLSSVVGSCRTLADDGICRLTDCPEPVTTPTPSLDAGTVRVIGEQTIELARGANGAYTPPSITGAIWTPGQSVTAEWDGTNGDPPALSTLLEGPGPVRLAMGPTVTVDPNQGLVVAWQGTVPASVLSGMPLGSHEFQATASTSIIRSAGVWSFTVGASSYAGTVSLSLAPSAP
jgi:hypothetical protein